MRVLVVPADDGRCGRRLIWPAQALRARGYDVTVSMPDDEGRSNPDIWLKWAGEYDVIVVQRAMVREQVHQVRAWKALGVCVVLDLDDNFRYLDRSNAFYNLVHPSTSPDSNFVLLWEVAKHVDLLTCTAPRIAKDYAFGGRYRIIPNHIPAWYLDVPHEPPGDGVYIGWTGSKITHGEDLQETCGAVARAMHKTGAGFAVVGDAVGVHEALWINQAIPATGWLPLDEYPKAMAAFDIGIVPLKLSVFNHSKSWLKGLEFASLGVPFVASPTDTYREFCKHAGLLASKPLEWERHLRRLVRDEPYRMELSAKGREYAATQTIEGCCEDWWDAWSAAYAKQRKAIPV
jgi:glycosyltransferase involved in cell wall biosynthesis